jgi:hypothetical protein
MAQTTCSTCGGDLGGATAACPRCGALVGTPPEAPTPASGWWKALDWPLVVGIALCVVGFALSGFGQRAGQVLEAVGVVVITAGWIVSRRKRT